MSLTQFAMVEELDSLIKDNLQCKHLVLSMEETLVDFLQDDTSLDGVLELEPMNPYSRLLLHRLAEIFGFSHLSTGEGEDRHLILERCQDSSIPSILVGDLLMDYDECQSLTSSQLLSRRDVSSVLKDRTRDDDEVKAERPITQGSLEEREAAYVAARERIFSCDKEETKRTVKKPLQNLVVARRMIAHALGQNIDHSDQLAYLRNSSEFGDPSDGMSVQEKERPRKNRMEISVETNKPLTKVGASGERKQGTSVRKENTKEEHMGAAKRMFANALGIHSTRDTILSKSNQLKPTNK